jgi:glycine cleavage system aminomethyltransferase T
MHNNLTTFTKSFSPKISNRQMGKIKSAMQREGGEIIKDVILANIHEQARAFLTKTAMDNLGALSALETHLARIAPSGQERYRHIVDAYMVGAAQKIWRW